MKKIKEERKIILDACCGSRMFWFDKENPLVTFADIRDEEHTLCDGRTLKIHPDVVADFTNMPFADGSFKLVVFDPPHLPNAGEKSWLAKKYGKLPKDWPTLISKGFNECFRVLEDYGILIFKWNEDKVKVKDVLKVIDRHPLFGHTTGRLGKTIWMCFMKIPAINQEIIKKENDMGRIEVLEAELQKLKEEEKKKSIEKYQYLIGKCLRKAHTSYEKITEITSVYFTGCDYRICYNCINVHFDNRGDEYNQNSEISLESYGKLDESDLQSCIIIPQEEFDKAFEDCVALMRRRVNQ